MTPGDSLAFQKAIEMSRHAPTVVRNQHAPKIGRHTEDFGIFQRFWYYLVSRNEIGVRFTPSKFLDNRGPEGPRPQAGGLSSRLAILLLTMLSRLLHHVPGARDQISGG
jgi:hypothetical protein